MIQQKILTAVMTSIFADKNTDHARLLLICFYTTDNIDVK